MRFALSCFVHVLVFASLALPSRSARAAGCIVTPDAASRVVQAGEEILFVVDKAQITMHVKLRYSGQPGDFGWLLPLSSIPTDHRGMPGIDVGSDELFTQLENLSQPSYALLREPCLSDGVGCGTPRSAGNSDWMGQRVGMSVIVKQSTVGPYDYAILKADDKSELLRWLSTHRYTLPSGSDAAIDSYIRPGAYLLALRLTAGATLGELQPVVLSYPGTRPTIPITMTSINAAPNMGIVVWVLGPGRAVATNYANVVINPLQLDWLNQLQNYEDVVTRAIAEAPNKRAFVTEYADGNYGIYPIDQPGRFVSVQTLVNVTDPVQFVQGLLPLEATGRSLPFGDPVTYVQKGLALNGQFFAVVGAHIPMPQQLIAEGVTPEDYYRRIDSYLRTDRMKRPAAYADIEAKLATFNPKLLVDDLHSRIVEPTLRAAKLFEPGTSLYLTRLFTTMSPADMNRDPVFGFNLDLPEVSNGHRALFDVGERCYFGGAGRITLQDREALLLDLTYTQEELDQKSYKPQAHPYSLRIETLPEFGMPMVVMDNWLGIVQAQRAEEPMRGCSTLVSRRPSGAPYLALCGLAITALLLRRRRTGSRSLPA